jgi:hypothetical protein
LTINFIAVDEFLSASTRDLFGQSVIYTPLSGDPITIRAVFDEGQMHVDIDASGVPVEFVKTTLCVRLADLPWSPAVDDQVTLDDGRSFRVTETQVDIPGSSQLVLVQV